MWRLWCRGSQSARYEVAAFPDLNPNQRSIVSTHAAFALFNPLSHKSHLCRARMRSWVQPYYSGNTGLYRYRLAEIKALMEAG